MQVHWGNMIVQDLLMSLRILADPASRHFHGTLHTLANRSEVLRRSLPFIACVSVVAALEKLLASSLLSGTIPLSVGTIIWIVVLLVSSLLECITFTGVLLAFGDRVLRDMLTPQPPPTLYAVYHTALIPVWGLMLVGSLPLGGIAMAVLASTAVIILSAGLSSQTTLSRPQCVLVTLVLAGGAILIWHLANGMIAEPLRGLSGYPFI